VVLQLSTRKGSLNQKQQGSWLLLVLVSRSER
jgi:hypothetical protein